MNINILVIELGIKDLHILKKELSKEEISKEEFNFFWASSFLDIIDIIYKETVHCIIFSDFRGREATIGYIKMFKTTNPHIKLIVLSENISNFDELKSYYIQKGADFISIYNDIGAIHNFLYNIFEEINNNEFLKPKWHNLTNRFLKFIKFNYNNPNLIKKFEKETDYSYTTIIHYVKKDTGKNCNRLINEIRIKNAISLILNTNYPLKYISEKVGFKSVQGFIKVFKNIVGELPAKFRQKYFNSEKFNL